MTLGAVGAVRQITAISRVVTDRTDPVSVGGHAVWRALGCCSGPSRASTSPSAWSDSRARPGWHPAKADCNPDASPNQGGHRSIRAPTEGNAVTATVPAQTALDTDKVTAFVFRAIGETARRHP